MQDYNCERPLHAVPLTCAVAIFDAMNIIHIRFFLRFLADLMPECTEIPGKPNFLTQLYGHTLERSYLHFLNNKILFFLTNETIIIIINKSILGKILLSLL